MGLPATTGMAQHGILGLEYADSDDDEGGDDRELGAQSAKEGTVSGKVTLLHTYDSAKNGVEEDEVSDIPIPAAGDIPQAGASPNRAVDNTADVNAENGTNGAVSAARESLEEECILPPEYREPIPLPDDPVFREKFQAVQGKIARWIEYHHKTHVYLTSELRNARDYKNPDFLKHMVDHYSILQYGTCFSSDVFDVSSLPKEDYIEELRRKQRERLQAEERRQRTKLDFHKGGVQVSSFSTSDVNKATAELQAKAQRMMLGRPDVPAPVPAPKKLKWEEGKGN